MFQEPIIQSHEQNHLEVCYLLVIKTERKVLNKSDVFLQESRAVCVLCN